MFNILDVAAPTLGDMLYTYSENIISFILGFIVGVVIVVIIKLIKKKKSNK